MDEGRYLALSVDYAETIPDVIWPVSNITYSMMRNDPAVSAVLSAITLPIRRATWAVDPAGCRPKIAQMVADDLGLPVLGVSKPTAARTRGVSWPEHLRAALMYLVYGHAAFEMLADVSSGMARLVGLYERVQHTISFIHSTPDGDFGGISQFYHPDRKEAPEIGADRMVFYSHSREGSAWHGRSLLRPMYASFLLKREAQRILATSSRRFGMGVPTVEWVPGATPTPAQMTAAQQAASAARVGDESGLALPPGATLVLKGLTGGTPPMCWRSSNGSTSRFRSRPSHSFLTWVASRRTGRGLWAPPSLIFSRWLSPPPPKRSPTRRPVRPQPGSSNGILGRTSRCRPLW
jgi:hypothetical protein